MILYVEKKYAHNLVTKKILKQHKHASVLYIDHYKNIFDKNMAEGVQKSFIVAGVNNAVSQAPENYGHPGYGFFFKTGLNCIFDCSYCYLRGSFKNNTNVIFVNYDDIKKQIIQKIQDVRKQDTQTPIWFYSSDYSDNLALSSITDFVKEFVPFFEQFENVFMEIRTKSLQIQELLEYSDIKNTEIAFSLNPSEVVAKYETGTPKLEKRIECINLLMQKGYKVGIRFMPLLQIPNYQKIYTKFLQDISSEIRFDQIYSVFIGGLLYTKNDYNKIIAKDKHLDILYTLQDAGDGYYRETPEVRQYFYSLFDELLQEAECNRCLE